MDLSKLDQNERMATFGAIAVLLAGLISSWGGLLFLAILAAIGMLVVVFLPQFSPQTTMPGSKGSLMAALGIVAAGSALITLLQWISVLSFFAFNAIMFLVALVGALVMAWAGWQELQVEGGAWKFGAGGSTSPAPTANRDEPMRPARTDTDDTEIAGGERRTEA